jgi:hypothetical protein
MSLGGLEVRYPNTSANSGDAWSTDTSPANAYDLNPTSSTSTRQTAASKSSIKDYSGFSAASQTYTALKLRVRIAITPLTDTTVYLKYSTNGGGSWTTIKSYTATQAAETVEQALTTTQDLTALQVRIQADTGSGGSVVIMLLEIDTEGTYSLVETLRPTASSTSGDAATANTNPEYAYDADLYLVPSFEQAGPASNKDSQINYTTWESKTKTYTSLTLKTRHTVTTCVTGATVYFDYSTNGGSSWTNLATYTAAQTSGVETSTSLSTSQDLSQLQVRVRLVVPSGLTARARLHEVWTEGAYVESSAAQSAFFLNFV